MWRGRIAKEVALVVRCRTAQESGAGLVQRGAARCGISAARAACAEQDLLLRPTAAIRLLSRASSSTVVASPDPATNEVSTPSDSAFADSAEAPSEGPATMIADAGRNVTVAVRRQHSANDSSELRRNRIQQSRGSAAGPGPPARQNSRNQLPMGVSEEEVSALSSAEALSKFMENSISRGDVNAVMFAYREHISSGKIPPTRFIYKCVLEAASARSNMPFINGVLAHALRNNVELNVVHYNFALRASARKNYDIDAVALLEEMITFGGAATPDSTSYSFVVAALAGAGKISMAFKYIERMRDMRLMPSRYAYSKLVDGCVRAHQSRRALEMVFRLEQQRFGVSAAMMSYVLSGCTEGGDVFGVLEIINMLEGTPQTVDGETEVVQPVVLEIGLFESVLMCACINYSPDIVERVWMHMRNVHPNNLPSDAAYYAVAITRGVAGDMPGAFEIMHEMRSHGMTVSPRMMKPLIQALAREPAIVDHVYFDLAQKKASGGVVGIDELNCVITACAQLADAERTFETFQELKNTFDVKPNTDTYNALLLSCLNTEHYEATFVLREEMIKSNIPFNSETVRLFVLLCLRSNQDRHLQHAIEFLRDAEEQKIVPSHYTLKLIARKARLEKRPMIIRDLILFARKFGIPCVYPIAPLYLNEDGRQISRAQFEDKMQQRRVERQ